MPDTISISSIQDGLQSSIGEVTSIVAEHPVAVGAGVVGAAALGAGIVALASSSSKKKTKRKTHKKIKHTSRGWKQDRARRSKQKWEVAYQKRKRKLKARRRKGSHRRGTHYTKNGQPYIILKSGKARFIKKHSKRRYKR
jgi:Flp pilus assembly protein TadB